MAIALRRTLPARDGREPANVGVILTGGNVDPALVAELISRYAEAN